MGQNSNRSSFKGFIPKGEGISYMSTGADK